MSGTEWFCGVQLGGVKLPAEFPAARNSKSMVHAGTGRWRQKNGRPMLIVGSRLAVYRMAVLLVLLLALTPSHFQECCHGIIHRVLCRIVIPYRRRYRYVWHGPWPLLVSSTTGYTFPQIPCDCVCDTQSVVLLVVRLICDN